MTEVVLAPQSYDLVTFHGDEVVLRHDGSPPEVMRARLLDLTHAMLAAVDAGQERVSPHVEHQFIDGMYLRKMYIPKGTLLAGQIHRKACMNIVALGDITVLTEFGCRRVTAGFTGASEVGIQKIGYAHEDTIFINVFRTDEIDLDKIENDLGCFSHTDLLIGADKGIA